jgi:hypothetical protein
MGQECYKKKEKCIYNIIIKSITTYGCEFGKLKKKNKGEIIGLGNRLLTRISKNM